MNPSLLVAASAAIIGSLGFAHLILTFRGPKLLPRDRALVEGMRTTRPVITPQTTIWKMWIGFNASHAMGAMLFGLVYGHLALYRPEVLFGSPFLQATGLAMLGGFTWLAKRYWFVVPFTGACLATALYAVGLVLARVG